ERHQNVANQLAGVEATPLQLSSGAMLRLTNWVSEVNRGTATFDPNGLDGRSTLHIQTGAGDSLASSRQRLLLAPGSYALRADVRCAHNGAPAAGAPKGVAIRISGRSAPVRVPTGPAWTKLEFIFAVREGEEDIQFVCECRGSNVQAWFDLDSLVLQ